MSSMVNHNLTEQLYTSGVTISDLFSSLILLQTSGYIRIRLAPDKDGKYVIKADKED